MVKILKMFGEDLVELNYETPKHSHRKTSGN